MADNYKRSGVNLQAGYDSVSEISKQLKRFNSPISIGSFGGVFDLSQLNYKAPVLVSGTDGVGTKLDLAFKTNIHNTIGIDLVAMCVNDILAQGAKPLYFLDYIAMHQVDSLVVKEIVSGIVDGCLQADCVLIGGETAEMRDLYAKDHYDLAGFVVGCVEKARLIEKGKVETGNILIGIPSSGIHSNGYSLVRQILFKDNNYNLDEIYSPFDIPLKEVLLCPTKIYIKPVLEVLECIDVKGIVHITGGGFYENIPRILTSNQKAVINKSSFDILPIFNFLSQVGNISEKEMFNVFNMGIGMILAVDENDVEDTLQVLKLNGEEACVIGSVIEGEGVEIID